MSWLSRSIASLRIDDDEDHHTSTNANHSQSPQHTDEDEEESDNQGRGVKEDLSELRETLTRQLWGVASFLAPPPHLQTDPSVSDCNQLESPGQSYEDASEFAYRSGSSKFSDFLPSRLDEEDAIGVTEEVLAFARNIAHHPETWLDFPLSEEDDMNDFDMSDAQRKHAMAVERLAPRLAALRFELCPAHMSEGYFWKVYFVLLHSRLNKHDAELLSTSQIVEARAMWMQELQKRTKPEPDWFPRSTFYSKESPNSPHEDFDPTSLDSPSGNTSLRTSSPFAPTTYYATTDFPTEKHPIASNEISIIDKSVIKEEPVIKTNDKEFAAGPSYKIPVQDYDDDDGDDWLDENSELDGYSGTGIIVGTDEDVSFSDLEDNGDCTMPTKSKIVSKDLESS